MRIQLLLFAVLLVPAVHAQDSAENEGRVIEKPVVADTPETFAKQTEWITNEMKDGGRYEFAKPADKQRVSVLLGQMANLMQRSGSVAAMDPSAKITLFNYQEEVNGILKHNDSNRLVCEHVKPVGSNIPQTHCYTFGQIEQVRRSTQTGLREFESPRCGATSSSAGSGKPGISSCMSR